MTRDRPYVVMVDDDQVDAILLSKAFIRAGVDIEFDHVAEGAELLERFSAEDRAAYPTPDVVLLDINMPAMNGFEVLRRLRANESYCALPIVMFTTSSRHTDIEASYQAGANSYVVNPSTIAELVEFVRTFHQYWFRIAELPALDA